MKNNVFQGIFKLIEHKTVAASDIYPTGISLFSQKLSHYGPDSRYTAVVTFSLSTVTLCSCLKLRTALFWVITQQVVVISY
jgi:hypothetical protein